MQGQRGVIGSLAGSLEFEHGSSSGSAAAEPHLYWNGMQNPDDSQLLDFTPPTNNIVLLDSMDLPHQNLTRWHPGESSSTGMHQEGRSSERRTENMWSSSSLGGSSSLLENRVYPHSNNVFSLDSVRVEPSLIQSSSMNSTPPNLNVNAGFVGDGSAKSPLVECPSHLLSIGSGSDSFGIASATGGSLRQEIDGRRGCPADSRRIPCKRKSYEGHIGQSSRGGNSSYLQSAGTGAWPATPTACNFSINPSFCPMSEPADPRNGLNAGATVPHNLPDLSIATSLESVQGNFCTGMNSSTQNNSNPSPLLSAGSAIANADSHTPVDLRPAPAMSGLNGQGHPPVMQVPVLPSSGPSLRCSRRSISRSSSSSGAVSSGNREAPIHGEPSSSSIARNTSQHPTIIPPADWATLVQHHTAMHATNRSVSIPGNVASTSRNGSTSGHQPSFSNLIPHHNRHSQFPQRLSEYVRRSLVAAMDSESGQSSHTVIGSGPLASSSDTIISSRAGNQGRRPHPPRPVVWPERQGDGLTRIPYSIRTLAAASAGRRRLSSELRNVLDIMHRGEGLHIEDVMILDPLFFGVADIPDRHRDMRLDVDNMSYEELLALEERIGNVNTGLTEETILYRMKKRKYSIDIDAPREAEPCCICQEEYNDGEDLGTLECGHDFHRDCIKQWLMRKNLCPICKAMGLNTSKAAGVLMEV